MYFLRTRYNSLLHMHLYFPAESLYFIVKRPFQMHFWVNRPIPKQFYLDFFYGVITHLMVSFRYSTLFITACVFNLKQSFITVHVSVLSIFCSLLIFGLIVFNVIHGVLTVTKYCYILEHSDRFSYNFSQL